MKCAYRLACILSLTLCLASISLPVEAQQLGVYFVHPQEAAFTESLARALGDRVTIRNFKDQDAMIKMLTRFNQLDAVLITKALYHRHNSAALIPLTEVKISGDESSGLVLATHSFLSKAQQEQLLFSYQELLLSVNGLELLEVYATGRGNVPKPAATPAVDVQPAQATPAPEAKPQVTLLAPATAAAPKPQAVETPPSKLKAASAEATAPSTPQIPAPQAATPVKSPVAAPKAWRPHVDITGKLGNDKSLGELELFVPIAQSYDRLFFLDLRFQLDDNDETEGNFGLGFRKILQKSVILGGYAFYDRRESSYNNEFQQLTVGAEALTDEFDVRVNAYLAEDKDYLVARQESLDQVIFSGFNLVHQTGGPAFEIREKAMSGFDAEFGWLFPWFDTPEIRGYLGGFHFSASGVEDISGPRGRLEVRFPDIFGWSGSLFELGGEVRHDEVRDTDYFVSARGRIPFGSVTQAAPQPQGLSARMTERIQRDPDIVVAKQKKDSSTPLRKEILTDGGNAITVMHVDSQSAGGDGSVDKPVDSLATAVDSGSDIVLLRADSVFDGEAVALQENQRLLGATVAHNLTINTDKFGLINLPSTAETGQMPIITNPGGTAVELASGSEVSGIHLTGATKAIYGFDVGGVNINRNVITNVDDGIILESLIPHPSTIQIRENTISDTFWDGIYISNDDITGSVKAKVSDNQLQRIGGAGIIFDNSGSDMTLLISGNTISGTADEGIIGFNLPAGTTLSSTVTGNTIDNVGDSFDGIGFVNTGDTLNLYLQNNHVNGDILNSYADYYIDNQAGTTFQLGASSGYPALAVDTDNGVIAAEGNTRADAVSIPNVDVFGAISIVDKNSISTP